MSVTDLVKSAEFLTDLDAGVLIAAARAEGELAARSLAILDDPKRAFASSSLVKLEVLLVI